MPYDPDNATDVAALKTEITTDPAGVGYGDPNQRVARVTRLLNDPDANPGVATIQRAFPDIALRELFTRAGTETDSPIVASEYAAMSELDKAKLQAILTGAISGQGQSAFIDEPIRLFLRNAFPNAQASISWNNITGLRTVKASRAQELFGGYDTKITRAQVTAARDS